jgi:hypothetical protein
MTICLYRTRAVVNCRTCMSSILQISLANSTYLSLTHTHIQHIYIQVLVFISEMKLCKASMKTWLCERYDKQAADAYREILVPRIYVQKV